MVQALHAWQKGIPQSICVRGAELAEGRDAAEGSRRYLDLDVLREVLRSKYAIRCRLTLKSVADVDAVESGPELARLGAGRPDRAQFNVPSRMFLPDTEVRQQRRLEHVLRQAIDLGRIRVPYIALSDAGGRGPEITSLEAPQHIADPRFHGVRILNDLRGDSSSPARAVAEFSPQNATNVFCMCPVSLLLGFQSHDGPGGVRFPPLMSSQLTSIRYGDVESAATSGPSEGTLPCAVHSAVLNLTGLRQLGFPLCDQRRVEWDRAGQTVLAALALVLFELLCDEIRGFPPHEPGERPGAADYEVLGGETLALASVSDAIALLNAALRQAERCGLVWGGEVVARWQGGKVTRWQGDKVTR